MQGQSINLIQLISDASLIANLVLLVLVIFSIVSWAIIISRSTVYKNARAKADAFEDKFWSGIDLNNLYQECSKKQEALVGLEVIYTAGFKEFKRLLNTGPAEQDVVMDGTYRQMKVSESREIEHLEDNLATLATIGSISPYIGLFGTVWGIMNAFINLGAVKNASLAMVAPPIAEALIATAMGLFAAIPAVMFYNRFISKVEKLENRYVNFMDEFSTILNRQLVRVHNELAKKEQYKEENRQNYGYQQAQPQNQQARAYQPQQQAYMNNQNNFAQNNIQKSYQPQPTARQFNHPLGEQSLQNSFNQNAPQQNQFQRVNNIAQERFGSRFNQEQQ